MLGKHTTIGMRDNQETSQETGSERRESGRTSPCRISHLAGLKPRLWIALPAPVRDKHTEQQIAAILNTAYYSTDKSNSEIPILIGTTLFFWLSKYINAHTHTHICKYVICGVCRNTHTHSNNNNERKQGQKYERVLNKSGWKEERKEGNDIIIL